MTNALRFAAHPCKRTRPGKWLSMLCVVGLAMMLSGCRLLGETASYRYKLTICLDTPDGAKTASTVIEVKAFRAPEYWKAISMAVGNRTNMSDEGQALYLDLGSGRRPLVVLLNRAIWELAPKHDQYWSPMRLINPAAYEEMREHSIEAIQLLRMTKGVFSVRPNDLPDLVTFADALDPKTAMYVDPIDVAATLGPGVRWRDATIEITEEPVTRGLEQKLPWLKTMTNSSHLDGDCCDVFIKKNLSNKLQRSNFMFPYPQP